MCVDFISHKNKTRENSFQYKVNAQCFNIKVHCLSAYRGKWHFLCLLSSARLVNKSGN